MQLGTERRGLTPTTTWHNTSAARVSGRRWFKDEAEAATNAAPSRNHDRDDPYRRNRDGKRDRDQQNLNDRLMPADMASPGLKTVF